MRMGIAGVTGRMGQLLVEEVTAAKATLAGGINRPGSSKLVPVGVKLFPDLAALAADSDVVIDFSHAAVAVEHATILVKAGKSWILGTSGLSLDAEAAVAEAAKVIPVVYASNFAAGVNLVLALAEKMGAALPAETYDAEISDTHHRQKVDSPSGTAIGIGRAVATGRGIRLEDHMISGRNGHHGARKTGEIGFAAVRAGQVVGEHSLLFASATEHIMLTHRAFDRRAFAAGAVRAGQWLQGKPAQLYDMMDVLGMR
ncbi:MAG: 4-hydroxy-tetrahydrodipicolinate reductase [Acetobacteraceae bacterium]|nr:4-hydroxy-tetrahydrodipicolinate reductase [Acetobacteraceae bacterium]